MDSFNKRVVACCLIITNIFSMYRIDKIFPIMIKISCFQIDNMVIIVPKSSIQPH